MIRERIEQARIRAEAEKRRRAELAEARKAGLARRHAQKLRRLAQLGLDLAPPADNTTPAASSC